MRIVSLLLILALSVHLAAAGDGGADQPLPPREAAATMKVPDGFQVTLFAGEPDVMQPIGFCIDDRGRLWVAEAYNYPHHGNKPGDRIIILEDSDGDGQHDKRTVFYEGLNYVSGIEVGFGGAWVMSPPSMYFIPDADRDDKPDGKAQVVLDGFGNHANAHNMANGFAWGPDGWLYATHGRTNWSMIGKPGSADDQRVRFDGGVWRYHPVRDVWEPYADGTTNPWGIDWNDYGHAFVCNCVNPHLFQVIQGAHYEPWRGRKSSEFAYQRIDTIADHLHFVGLGNVRNGLGSDAEDAAGGGHAHCGTMIYLGDSFPRSYRNQLFTNNIHGRRINNDLLRRTGSGYVASHGPDLMRSRDSWFMGVTLAFGPGGEVYVSDWSDTGECHSTRNTRRHTGRVYRITYGDTKLATVEDVGNMSNQRLVQLQQHDNDWWVRHARRVLHERAQSEDLRAVHADLQQQFSAAPTTPKKLRLLWALKVTGGLTSKQLVDLLSDEDEHLRAWAVQLLCEDGKPSPNALQQMRKLASHGRSPLVRLALASGLQRLSPSDRWPIAEALAARSEDVDDQNLPLMYWYGIEPLIAADLDRYARLAVSATIPRVRTNIARRIASSPMSGQGLTLLCDQLAQPNVSDHLDVITGILQGLKGRRRVQMPNHWPVLREILSKSADDQTRQAAMQLALVFDDPDAKVSLIELAQNSSADSHHRIQAIQSLSDSRTGGFDDVLLQLLNDEAVREAALRGLSEYDHREAGQTIIQRYSDWPSTHQQSALSTLASRSAWAAELLTAVEDHRIPAKDLTAVTVRQIRAAGDEKTSRRLARLWGNVRETPKDRAKQISKLKTWLTPTTIARGDQQQGKALFTQHCGKCHRFFGEGGTIGPDITGAQRTNLNYLLENIVDPSASVSKDYQMQIVATHDGRVITGLIESETARSLTIVTTDQKITLPLQEIESRKQSAVSIMPNDLLKNLSDAEVRDLFAYLQR